MVNPWNSNYNELQAWPNANRPQFTNLYHMGDYSQHTSIYNHEEPEESEQAHLNQILELPQLDSPSLSTGLGTNEGFELSATNNVHRDYYNSQFVDWKAIDELLASQLTDQTSCSNSNSNLPVVPIDYGADAPNEGNHFLGLFGDS